MENTKLLVVDDDELTRDILSSILDSCGYTVLSASDGKDALEKFRAAGDIGLVVSDINMPGMNGVELIEVLRKEDHTEVPIVVLSGNDEISVAIDAINKGASTYLLKDENIDQTVPIAVEQALEKHRIVNENRRLMEDLKSIVKTMTDMGISLTSEKNFHRLMDVVVSHGMKLANADGGRLYLNQGGSLSCKIIHCDSLGLHAGECEESPSLEANGNSLAARVVGEKSTLKIADATSADEKADLTITKAFDTANGYKTVSLMAVPLKNNNEDIVGVLELFNARDHAGETVPFTESKETLVESLASQAALVIENTRLHEENIRSARLSALGEGIAGAAHCIKNILTGFDGGRVIVDVGFKRNDMKKVNQGWDMLKRNSDILKQLVLDMLDYSKERPPRYGKTNVNKICTDICDLERPRASERNCRIETDLQEKGLEDITADSKGLYRCILNLVGNAVDAMPDGKENGIITVSTRRPPGSAEFIISVEDNGTGISEENLGKIFRPFFSTKGSKKGTGLGLAVTQKIIHEHGGRLDVSSKPGEGTRFTVTMPCTKLRSRSM